MERETSHAPDKARAAEEGPTQSPAAAAEEPEQRAEVDRILARLDTEIPKAMKEMDALLARLRRPIKAMAA